MAGCGAGRASGASAPDEDLQADLAAMRDLGSRLSQANRLGLRSGPLHHEHQRLERAVRARALRTLGTGPHGTLRNSTRGFDVSGLLAELKDDRLLELVDIEGQLHVLVCGDGRVRRSRPARPSKPRARSSLPGSY